MTKTLLNPVEVYPETKLLIAGTAALAAGSTAAYFAGGRFDGVIDFHLVPNVSWQVPFLDNIINTVSLLIFLYIAGYIINKRTRIIDILTTSLIARVPFYILPLAGGSNVMRGLEAKSNPANPDFLNFTTQETLVISAFAIFAIATLVWFIILLYNGFKTAANAKTLTHKFYFAIAVLLAEVLSSILTSLF
jgi:hypothetical protein